MTTLRDVLLSALSFVGNTTLPQSQRLQWSRVAAFALSELPENEAATAAVLAAATKCLDAHEAVRVLVIGVWCVCGDGPKVPTWTLKLIERARTGGHVRTALGLVELLVRMDHFAGALPPDTVMTVLGAVNDVTCHPNLLDLAWYHHHRFGPVGINPAWVGQILDDPRVLEGARHVPRSAHRLCPTCNVTPIWAVGLMRRPSRAAATSGGGDGR
jgi:hypothetical protein